MDAVKSVISITFILVFLYLILNNSKGTTAVLQGISSLYTNSVTVLQGRSSTGLGGGNLP